MKMEEKRMKNRNDGVDGCWTSDRGVATNGGTTIEHFYFLHFLHGFCFIDRFGVISPFSSCLPLSHL